MDYAADVDIDESALDVAWLDQARLMGKYCRLAAQAHREVERAQDAVDVEKAIWDKKIRSDPATYGLAKPTEASIAGAILQVPEYQVKRGALIDAKFDYDVAQAAVRAFDHRKSALENLVRLHAASYFAGPSVPRDLTQERMREARTAESNRRVAMRRTR